MDVVRRSVEALHGHVDIASEAGKGSTFTIRLPLTLAITDGMLVRVGRRALHHPDRQHSFELPTHDRRSVHAGKPRSRW